ncbi:hypothetical protein NCCP1664_13640 [Zafaria cholistanensis]|uniref:DNA modification methylase n=1 Tax=Zafaria cholistanensis TaxID=1682741 RepID=A0A5A7NSG7_9MICC|nr:hypothetical protein [Zafaria cholistanensis]GER22867.1 hypothetical protein NCCP1664_13640 [Zafaria cholistanensis]
MITAQKIRGRRAVAAAALAVIALGATGCGSINKQATTLQYAASDGIVFDVADLKARNLMLVTGSATEEARLIGTVVNATDAPQTLELKVGSHTASIRVPAKTSLKLEDDANEVVIPTATAEPGADADAVATAGSASTEVSIPVVNGALEEYRQYLPGGYDPATTEHLVKHGEAPAEH